MTSWLRADGLAWRLLQPFGVELDADLCAPLSPAAGRRLVSLLRDHALLVARGQQLSMQRQRELLGLFGPILIREGESGYLSNEGEHAAVKSGLSFHADAAYTPNPLDVISLHAVDVVDGASSTRFAGAERACGQLPGHLRGALAGREAEMISPGFGILAARVCDEPEPDAMLRNARPAILANPNTGRPYLNVSEMHTTRLLDMPQAQSRELLHAVFDMLYADDNRYEHSWNRGDLVIWDNQALQHARGSLESVGRRILQRVIVCEEGVAPHAAGQRTPGM